MSVAAATPREILIATIADLLAGVRLVAVGASSPIPAAGAMLLRARNEARGLERVRIVVLGSREHNFFTNGAVELFDCAAQGRVDAFFLGGGQIDGQGNINLVGTGDLSAERRPLAGLVRLSLPLLRRAARDPVSRGTFAARVRRQGRFHQRARRERRHRPQWRALCAADGPRAVRFRQDAQNASG